MKWFLRGQHFRRSSDGGPDVRGSADRLPYLVSAVGITFHIFHFTHGIEPYHIRYITVILHSPVTRIEALKQWHRINF